MCARGPDPDATTEKLLKAIRDHYAPAVGSTDIADEIGVARQTADRRLRKLAEDGLVDTDKVGNSRIWWLTSDGRRYLADQD